MSSFCSTILSIIFYSFFKHSLLCCFKIPYKFLALPTPYFLLIAENICIWSTKIKAIQQELQLYFYPSWNHSVPSTSVIVFYLKKLFFWSCCPLLLPSYISPFVHSAWFDGSRKCGFLDGHVLKECIYQ